MIAVSVPGFVALLGEWRPGGAAHERLAATLRALILDGRLAVDGWVPAERTLAVALGVSRVTVTAAYDRLRAEGYLASRRGAGSWVTLPTGHSSPRDEIMPASGIDLRIAALPAPAQLNELAKAAVAEFPAWLDHHGYQPLGMPALRCAIAERFTHRGIPTDADQILVSNGALQALDLLLRALVRRGQTVLAEIPTYPAALDALRGAGGRVRTVPVDAGGWDLEALRTATRTHPPVLAYLIPDFHNPTGALMDESQRHRALRLLCSAGACVVIDETFAELTLDDTIPIPPPAAAIEPRTVTIGSLGKAVWGGLRIGWVRAEPSLIHRLAAVRSTTDIATPVLEQLLAVQVLAHLDELLADRRRLARARRQAVTDALRNHLPTWSYTVPAGGLFLWVRLPGPLSTSLAVSAGEQDLLLTPGPRFGATGQLERWLRLPFTLAPPRLEQAAAILAQTTAGIEIAAGRAHPAETAAAGTGRQTRAFVV